MATFRETASASAFFKAASNARNSPVRWALPLAHHARRVLSPTPARRAAYFLGTPAAMPSRMTRLTSGVSFGGRPVFAIGLRSPLASQALGLGPTQDHVGIPRLQLAPVAGPAEA